MATLLHVMMTLPLPNYLQQIDALVAASSSLLGCQGLKRVFEMILTFGNYMNSGKRAAAYGFKIQSLDMVSYCKFLCLNSMLIL